MNLSCYNQLNVEIIPRARLSDYTTFKLGGSCVSLINCENPEQLKAVVTKLIRDNAPFILIGGGSNLVVADEGVPCHVVRYVSSTPLIKTEAHDVVVSASTALDDLVVYAIDEGLEGINFCSGIPGTVGGAIVGNAGAFGKQVGDILKSMTILTAQGEEKVVDREYCQFSYRHSGLKASGDIVLEARFELKIGDRAVLAQERAELLAIRHEKHPDYLRAEPCAGSFFRNIEPTSSAQKRQAAGWFLEEAGGKNLRVGGAMIYPKHANIIIKGENCTAQNVHDLHLEMKRIVKEKFNLDLVREVRFVGEFKGKNVPPPAIIW